MVLIPREIVGSRDLFRLILPAGTTNPQPLGPRAGLTPSFAREAG